MGRPPFSNQLNLVITDKMRLFALGRRVALAMPTTLVPSRADFKAAADKLEITQALALRAWNIFIWN